MKQSMNLFFYVSLFLIVTSSCFQDENLRHKSEQTKQNISLRSSELHTNQAITVLGDRVIQANDYSCTYSNDAICGILFDPALVNGSEVHLGENEFLTTFSIETEDTLVFEDWDYRATFNTDVAFAPNITVIEDTHLPVQVYQYFNLVGLPVIKAGIYDVLYDSEGLPYCIFDLEEALPYYNPTYPPLLTITEHSTFSNDETGEILGANICWKYTPYLIPQDGNSTLPWDTEFTITIKKLPSCFPQNSGTPVPRSWSQGELKNFMNDQNIPISDQYSQTFNYDHSTETWCYSYYFDEMEEEGCYVVQITFPDGSSTYAMIRNFY